MRTPLLLALLLTWTTAAASHFTGTYSDPQSGTTLQLQQGTDGVLQGTMNAPNGQFTLQGQGSSEGAYGVIASPQGTIGFQGQLSLDGQTLQLNLYQMGPDGQPTSQGQPLTLQRSAGGPSGGPGMPGGNVPTGPGLPGGTQVPGGTTAPGGFPGGDTAPGGFPGAPGLPGGGGTPGAPGGAFPGAPGGPGMPGAQMPPSGTVIVPEQPGTWPGAEGGAAGQGSGWNGAFVGDGGRLVMELQGQQGSYTGRLVFDGRAYPLRASGDPMFIQGTFDADAGSYEFIAERWEGGVLLVTGDTEYMLSPAAGPLGD